MEVKVLKMSEIKQDFQTLAMSFLFLLVVLVSVLGS